MSLRGASGKRARGTKLSEPNSSVMCEKGENEGSNEGENEGENERKG